MSNSTSESAHARSLAIAPWPFYSQRRAARLLGVSVEWLNGLVNNPIPAFPGTGRSGNRVWLFQKQAVDDLLIKMQPGTGVQVQPTQQGTEQQ